jgi:RNA 3'-terminal phosphate cyclase (ATP)
VRHGRFRFDIGTAGSTTLVLQTVLPALLYADGPSELTVTGGTHNPLAPPFEFLERAYLPLLRRMGAAVQAELVRPGYIPRGGGEVRLRIEPGGRLLPLTLDHRGQPCVRRATATVAGLPRHIAERELAVVASCLGWPPECLSVMEQSPKLGPGNVLTLELGFEQVTEVFTGFGQRGVPAEAVAEGAVAEARAYLDADVAVGPHLADQLLLPLALARGGGFTTVQPTRHTQTNWAVIRLFTNLSLEQTPRAAGAWRLRVQP